jgi:two-component system KDP operon response regulator KdpE
VTRVLVVDDEPQIRRVLTLNLSTRGYDVTAAQDGTQALLEASRHHPDVVLLDLGLPDIDGLQVIRELRTWTTTPIVVLSARTGSEDKVRALDLGADDYVQKPFDMAELLARLRAATRRVPPASVSGQIRLGPSTVDLVAKTVERDDDDGRRTIHLTPTEWHLLEILLRRPGALVTQRQLLTELRGSPDHTDHSYLRIYMAQLRRKLEDTPSRPRHLLTEPSLGYRFAP